jgi:hypothetical protein
MVTLYDASQMVRIQEGQHGVHCKGQEVEGVSGLQTSTMMKGNCNMH